MQAWGKWLLGAALCCGLADEAAADPQRGKTAMLRGDYATALAEVRPDAEAGNARAQFLLGCLYVDGHGVARDEALGFQWIEKAAVQGDAEAQHVMGVTHQLGAAGVAKDDALAVPWLRKSAEQGYAPGQYSLGIALHEGEGIARDQAEALRWFRKAADQGMAEAQYNVGVAYSLGEGTPKDEAQAIPWFRKAAAQGLKEAILGLGECYALGEGVPISQVAAYALFQQVVSADPKSRLAAHNLESTRIRIEPAEFARAQRLAREMSVPGGLLPALDAYLAEKSQ